jgi:molecular chaperone Hsp33
MDRIARGFSESTGLRFFYADVTESGRMLERRHLSGPAAGLVLGRSLAAAGLLWPNLSRDDEAISIQLKTDGPIGGFLVEVNAGGDLRGYTDQKILDEYDGLDDIDVSPLLGRTGNLAVIHSSRSRVLNVAQIQASPPAIRVALARYFNQSLQIPSAVELYTRSKDGNLRRSVGLVAQKMPGSDDEAFLRVLERFHDKVTRKFLESSDEVEDFQDLFRIEDLSTVAVQPLRFACPCNRAKTVDIVSTLPIEEIRAMAGRGESQRVICHFCGEMYTVAHRDLLEILERKEKEADS